MKLVCRAIVFLFSFCMNLKGNENSFAIITCSDASSLREEVETSLDKIYISPHSQMVPRGHHKFRVASKLSGKGSS